MCVAYMTDFVFRNTSVKSAAIGQAVSKDERREFMAVFPDIVRDLTETHRQTEIPDVTKWYSKVSEHEHFKHFWW